MDLDEITIFEDKNGIPMIYAPNLEIVSIGDEIVYQEYLTYHIYRFSLQDILKDFIRDDD